MKTLGILGGGHLGQQIAHYAISDNHYQRVVFFDDFHPTSTLQGYPTLGGFQSVTQAYQDGFFDELMIGVGYKHLALRTQLFEKHSASIPFGKIIHSTCWVDKTASIGVGSIVYPGCVIDAHVTIGSNTVINIACSISHDTHIAAGCFLGPRVAIAGFAQIQGQCFIGLNATIIDNIIIANGTKIGAGTVVTNSITQSGLYVGNPHRCIQTF